jgi:hypothetical protein
VTGTTKQPTEDGGEEEVETVGFKLNFTFKENPYFTNTVSGHTGGQAGGPTSSGLPHNLTEL